MKNLISYTDGGARGNPGPAAIGVVLKDEAGKKVDSYGRKLGVATNNQAEYQALISALESAKKLGAKEIKCYLDSELVVKQMRREYKVKDKNIQGLFMQAWNLMTNFTKITFTHIPREQNKEADSLVNGVLDQVD